MTAEPDRPQLPLRERLVTMRAELIAKLESGIEGGWLRLLSDVQTSITAIDEAERNDQSHWVRSRYSGANETIGKLVAPR